MDETRKKAFTMTQSLEDYLEAVFVILEEGRPAQVRDVAKMLSVKMPSVVKAIRELKAHDLVVQEPYSPILLTEKGKRLAKMVRSRHTLLRSFLVELGVGKEVADRDACLMEHILSAGTLDRIRAFTEKKRKAK